jgi:hypothetical protein
MGDLHLKECLIFFDDILVYSKTFDEHIERLQAVFSRLAENGLKLKPSKCELLMSSVVYLGHVISEDGISTDPEKTSAVTKWPAPKNIKELRQFLGFAGFYRRYVEHYAQIVEPLNDLLKGHNTTGRASKSKKRSKKTNKPAVWSWSDAQDQAFETIKSKLTSSPVLAYAQYNQPFILHTDASGHGLGAVFYQNQDGAEKVIAYASRGLKPSEKRYPAHKLEFLALKWAVTEKFHDYLFGNEFVILTDNNPLTYVTTTAKLDATGHRWLAALAAYNFSIKYKPGKLNIDADSLSRIPEVSSDMVQAITQASEVQMPLAECIAIDICPLAAEEARSQLQPAQRTDWSTAQAQDQYLARVLDLLRSGSRPREEALRKEPHEVQLLLREWKRLTIEDKQLYRTTS